MTERFVQVWCSQTGDKRVSSKENNQKCTLQGNVLGLHSEGWGLLCHNLIFFQPTGMAGALGCRAVLSTHSSGLGKFQRPRIKTLWASLVMDCGFSTTLENLGFLQSNTSRVWMLEKPRSQRSCSYPTGTWFVSGSRELHVWWFFDNSWPGLIGFFMHFWGRMMGEESPDARTRIEGPTEQLATTPECGGYGHDASSHILSTVEHRLGNRWTVTLYPALSFSLFLTQCIFVMIVELLQWLL